MEKDEEVKYIDQVKEMEIPEKFEMIKKAFAKTSKNSSGAVATIDYTSMKDTSTTYTRDALLQALSSTDETGNNTKTLVQASRWLYKRSGEYRQLIHRFAGIHKYRYVVMPKLAIDGDITDAYNAIGDYCINADIENTCLNIAIKVLVDGCAYTYETVLSDGKVVTQFLPADYCRTVGFDAFGNAVVQMNFKFFDEKFSDATQRDLVLKSMPKEFTTCYNNCTNRKSNVGDDKNYQWQQLDPKFARATYLSLDKTPFFSAVLVELIDYMQFKEMNKLSSELDLFTILVQKAEFDKEGNLLVDDEVMDSLSNTLSKIAKTGGCGSFTTPFNVEALRVKQPNQKDLDYVEKGLTGVYNAVSLPEVIMNSSAKNSGSSGISTSNQMTGGMFESLLAQFRRWYVSRFAEVSPSVIFDIKFLPVTVMNEKDMVSMYKEQFSLGGSTFFYMASLGISQFNLNNVLSLEEALGIKDMLKAPQSTYTTTGSESESGRPEKEPSERSEIRNDQVDKGIDKSAGQEK